ncbi:MAG: hypothetical protein WC277_11290 [Bacilli bacterium]
MTDALSPLVLNPGGESRVLPLMAVLEHLNGHTSLTGETRQDRINAQRRERYATDAEHREVRKTAARDRKRTLWATSPEYRERRRARHRWRYANDPEYRERRRASRVAAYYRAKCRPSAYGLMGVWEGLA